MNPIAAMDERNEARHLLSRWRVLYDLQRQVTSDHEKARTGAYRRLEREMEDWPEDQRERLLSLVRQMECH